MTLPFLFFHHAMDYEQSFVDEMTERNQFQNMEPSTCMYCSDCQSNHAMAFHPAALYLRM